VDFGVELFANPTVAQWHWPGELGGPRTREQVRAGIEEQRRQLRERGFCLWWWRERSSGELVGRIGLNATDVEGEEVVEVGWSVAPHRQREGLAAEAAAASLRHGFEVVGLDEIVAFCLPGNAASRGVMEKLGMTRERAFERYGHENVLYVARR
jgi:RimJ/RimL family protein N-acetyltransferase